MLQWNIKYETLNSTIEFTLNSPNFHLTLFVPIFPFMSVLSKIIQQILQNTGKHQSSRPEVFCKKHVCKNFTKSLATLLKKRLRHSCFPVNIAKFLRTPFFIDFFYRTPLVAASCIEIRKESYSFIKTI